MSRLLWDTLVLALGKQASCSPCLLLPDDQPFLSQGHLPLSWLCSTFISSRKPLLIAQSLYPDVLFPYLYPISSPESLSFKQAVPFLVSAPSILLTRHPFLTPPFPEAPRFSHCFARPQDTMPSSLRREDRKGMGFAVRWAPPYVSGQETPPLPYLLGCARAHVHGCLRHGG